METVARLISLYNFLNTCVIFYTFVYLEKVGDKRRLRAPDKGYRDKKSLSKFYIRKKTMLKRSSKSFCLVFVA